MKLTMPEGLGVLGAIVVGTVLAIGSQAATPQPAGESDESVRRALRKAVDDVRGIPGDGSPGNFKVMTLINIAEAQLKIGDRAAALATLKRAYESIDPSDPPKQGITVLGDLFQLVKHQREAGDRAGAKVSLDRATNFVESLTSGAKVKEKIGRRVP